MSKKCPCCGGELLYALWDGKMQYYAACDGECGRYYYDRSDLDNMENAIHKEEAE